MAFEFFTALDNGTVERKVAIGRETEGANALDFQAIYLVHGPEGSVPVIANTANPFPVGAVGTVAHGAADSGNPLKIGGKARTADPTPVTDGQRVDAYFDTLGRLVVNTAKLNSTYDTVTAHGGAAHDAVPVGPPVLLGVEARTTRRAAISANGDVARLASDVYGRLHIRRPACDQTSSNATPVASAAAANVTGPGTAGAIINAPGAGSKLKIHRLIAINTGATAVVAEWRGAAAGARRYPMLLAASVGAAAYNVDGNWELGDNEALFLYTSASGGTLSFHVDSEVVMS